MSSRKEKINRNNILWNYNNKDSKKGNKKEKEKKIKN
jgi:hypothetical protein